MDQSKQQVYAQSDVSTFEAGKENLRNSICPNETAVINLGGGDTRIKRSDLALAGSPIIDLKSYMKIEFTTNECDITQFRSLNDASKVGSTEDKTAL